ncbi:DUF6161 domain-containing protein [Bradyrhizobium sp. 6(2017)]|uniref:DUF6161 domain-containing protein n=1 Tax=Bradyrhizobium sp. 6(2017) TaxID=1197460 RepID=UPI0013E1CCF3|nr:DUF6161 domain-containing protein [Bradyrhizobium sp. 6(2017)]QIG92275.1 hypothetical protein G6P99_07000 [Bradyrhizobium sp. 6(2017)]
MESWSVIIPSQGVSIVGSKDDIVKFLNAEIAYFSKLLISGQQITLGGQGFGNLRLSEPAVEALTSIVRDVQANKKESLEEYVQDARARQVLIGASAVGRRVEQIKASSEAGAAILAAIYCTKWMHASHPAGRDIIHVFRAVAFANPANFAFDDLLSASDAAAKAAEASKKSDAAAQALNQFIDDKRALIGELEDLYRNKLTIEEPARSWQTIAVKKTRIWRLWLAIFALMTVAPIFAALEYWSVVSDAIGKLTGASNGGFSISGLAAISVPALLYAWLLKNISRVFIQNLNLADDADHRRSLALTYMGLLQNEKQPATDQDRAIILNALFRPIPPQTGDEGPPAGLLDLIQKK